jgi:hypothetical protein
MNARCGTCRRYLDGLTAGAERHPIYDRLCVGCGNAEQRAEGGHARRDQRLREGLLYPEACR